MKFIYYILIFPLALLCSLCALPNAVQAQAKAPGYQGKRLLLKTDPFFPAFQHGALLDVEYVLTRRISISASFAASARQHTQRLANYRAQFGTFPEQKATIKDRQGGVRLTYTLKDFPPAPIGIYLMGSYYQGSASAAGDVYDDRAEVFYPYLIENINSNALSFGLGNEAIIAKIIVIDFDMALTVGSLRLRDDVDTDTLLSLKSYADRYGPNIHSFGQVFGLGGFGLSGHFKVGILLF